ncbi:5786_t:CDS:10 [Diversispora eburnea]|uniref:RING-type E3 ubiquitin transferase n=1 Tax=Diversispora eburnea TaxID=1213867 RepID=A0A9N9BHX8_9GLOM|nr:5786_t:CDS:10 [Diversispora eburnea]
MSSESSISNSQTPTNQVQAHRGGHHNSQRGGQTGRRPYRRRGQGNYHFNNAISTQQTQEDQSIEIKVENPPTYDNACFICAEPIIYYALADCNHRTCHLCTLRLRALYESKNCAYCKTEQTKVIFTYDAEKSFQEYKDSDIPFRIEDLNIFCEDQRIYEDTSIILGLNCPDEKCETTCRGWSELKRHVKNIHRMWLCDLCIRYKKVFTHEHVLYTRHELEKHIEKGDKSGFKGHPECEFCKTTFYDDDELYEHCRDNHEQCYICLRNGIRHQYYLDYNLLETHFKEDHYLCLQPICLEKKFVVFESDIDLKAHEVEEHGLRKYDARRIEVNFYFDDDSPRRGYQRRRDDDDGRVNEDVARQFQQNLNITESNSNGNVSNTRIIRPPPGFGNLTPDEPQISPPTSRSRETREQDQAKVFHKEEFPTLSDSMKTTGSSNGSTTNYSERAKAGHSMSQSRPSNAKRETVNKGKAKVVLPSQPSIAETSSNASLKGKTTSLINQQEFPALPSSSSSFSSYSNHVSKAKINTRNYENSRQAAFFQRVSSYLSYNQSKIEEYNSLTSSFNDGAIDASSYIEFLFMLFNKNYDTVGKVISGFADLLDNEYKKRDLLRALQDRKATARKEREFPALEPTSLSTSSNNITNQFVSNRGPRVLVIKSSSTRFGGTRPTNSQVLEKVAAAAAPLLMHGKGKPKKIKNTDDFPELPSTTSKQRVTNNGKIKSAWGNGGAFTIANNDKDQETCSDEEVDNDMSNYLVNDYVSNDDMSNDVSNDEGNKRKQKKKQKTVLFHVG